MDEPLRHMELTPELVRKFRAMSPAESIALAAGLTDLALELSRAGGGGRPRFWRPKPYEKS